MNGPGQVGGGTRAWIRILSILVPRAERASWRREWMAELNHYASLHPTRRRRIWGRALGALPDAASLRLSRLSPAAAVRAAVDARHGVRSMIRQPAFAAVAVGTLAIGIGANTALFSIVDGVLLRPLPFGEPDRLLRVYGASDGARSDNVSYPNMDDLERRSSTLEGVAAAAWWRPALTEPGEAVVLAGATVSWDYFSLLGLEPAAGRFFQPVDEGEGRAPVVVISHGLWQTRFGGDPGVVDRSISVDNIQYRVVGVAPAGMEDPGIASWGRPHQIWRTPGFDAQKWFRSGRSFQALARLAPGVSLQAAQADADVVMEYLTELDPRANAGRGFVLRPLAASMVGAAAGTLLFLLGAVALVLLIGCVNLAALLMSRSVDRGGEIAVRTALGASRGRLVGQLLTESLVLAAAGAGAGLALAYLGLDAVVALAGDSIPRSDSIGLHGTTLLFTAGITVLSALAFGVTPALWSTGRGAASPALSGRGGSLDRRGVSLRRLLIRFELAMTVVLLVGATLLVRSLIQMGRVDLGIDVEGLLTLELHGSAWYSLSEEEAADGYRRVAEGLLSIPGVTAVGATDYAPLSSGRSCDGVHRADRPPPEPGQGECAEVRSVTPGVFGALGLPLLRGRGPEWSDDAGAPGVAFVSNATAELFWGDEDPIGKGVVVHSDTFTVAGIVGDLRHDGPAASPRPHLYLPAQQEPWNGITRGLTLLIRGPSEPGAILPAVRRELDTAVPGAPFHNVFSLEELYTQVVSAPRFRAFLFLGFGVSAMLLALVGVAGVMAHSVARRTREMGVRLALGAQRDQVLGLVLGEGASLTLGGLLIGVAGAVVAARVFEPLLVGTLLFDVGAYDPAVLLGVPLVLGAMAMLASAVPAWRAARTEPVEALRET